MMKQLGLLEYRIMQPARMASVSVTMSLFPDTQLMSVTLARARNSGNRVADETGVSLPSKLPPFSLMVLSFSQLIDQWI